MINAFLVFPCKLNDHAIKLFLNLDLTESLCPGTCTAEPAGMMTTKNEIYFLHAPLQ